MVKKRWVITSILVSAITSFGFSQDKSQLIAAGKGILEQLASYIGKPVPEGAVKAGTNTYSLPMGKPQGYEIMNRVFYTDGNKVVAAGFAHQTQHQNIILPLFASYSLSIAAVLGEYTIEDGFYTWTYEKGTVKLTNPLHVDDIWLLMLVLYGKQ